MNAKEQAMANMDYEQFISEYAFPTNGEGDFVRVVRWRFDADTWAVCINARCWNHRTQRFMIEPSNSSKTDQYILDHTLPLAKALPIAQDYAAEQLARYQTFLREWDAKDAAQNAVVE
jgi:hypothetical protein